MKLQIDELVYGGDGLAHDDAGAAVLLPFTLPGEVVAVEVSAGRAVSMEVLERSVHRIDARCKHFGACGGCQYQHMDADAQIAAKAGILRSTLSAAGLVQLPEIQPHRAEPWAYRNRIRLRVGMSKGVLRLGYNRRGSYELLPIAECPIAAPLLLLAAETALALVAGETAWAAQWTAVECFSNGDQSRLQMTFFLRSERGVELAAVCERLRQHVPELSGAGVVVVGASGKQERPGAHWGADGLVYRAAGMDYWVSRGNFFQVNRWLVEKLVGLVTTGQTGALAWDLYAGVGLFSRVLAEAFEEVVGVEVSAGDLAAVLKGTRHRAVGTTTVEFLRQAVIQRERPDLIVMDPPRAGLGAEVCGLLVRIKAPRMVYVSCDPQTLAQDLRAMVDSGYTIDAVHMIDLFPQTFHMETVVVLNR